LLIEKTLNTKETLISKTEEKIKNILLQIKSLDISIEMNLDEK
jgi:hypothetical protein